MRGKRKGFKDSRVEGETEYRISDIEYRKANIKLRSANSGYSKYEGLFKP